MTRPATKKTSKPSTESQSRSRATWVFGSLLLVFSVWVFVFAPDTLPEYKHRMLGIFLALLSGLFAFFLTGDMGLEIKSLESRFGKVGVKATGGIAIFALVLWWWSSPLAPIGVEKKLGEIKQDTEKIAALLQEELSIKNTQIVFLQGQLKQPQIEVPSPHARELAAQILPDADPYALALKAMAESRFDDARRLLGEAERNKEVELARIYEARGQTETYAGRYTDAVGWYRKALSLRPDDPDILNETAVALMYAGQYAEAIPLSQRALAIREKALGPEHPDVAQSLNNLAVLYNDQGKYEQAEPLYHRALAIWEKALGPDHPVVAASLENYANLLRQTNREAEVAKMEARAEAIRAKHAQENPTK